MLLDLICFRNFASHSIIMLVPSLRFHISSLVSVLVVNVVLSIDEVYSCTAHTDSKYASVQTLTVVACSISNACMWLRCKLVTHVQSAKKKDNCRYKININMLEMIPNT